MASLALVFEQFLIVVGTVLERQQELSFVMGFRRDSSEFTRPVLRGTMANGIISYSPERVFVVGGFFVDKRVSELVAA